MHSRLGLAFAPERNRDVADAHRLGDAGAPSRLELGAHGRFAAARLPRHHQPPHAGAGQVHAALARPFRQVQGIGGRHRRDGRLQKIDRRHQALGVSRADGNVAEAQPVERAERGAGDEGACIVGRDDPLAARQSRRRVGARRSAHPDLEIGRGQGNVARRSRGAAGGIDAHDFFARRRAMGSNRLLGAARLPQFVFLGERQRRDCVEAAHRPWRSKTRARELVAIKARAVEQILDLLEIQRRVVRRLSVPRRQFDFGLDHAHRAASNSSDVCRIASSPFAASRKPIGTSASSPRCAMRPAVRARIGMPRIDGGGHVEIA